MDDVERERFAEREDIFAEAPFAAQGGAIPAGAIPAGGLAPYARGPFRLVVLAHGLSGLAFWGYFGTVFAEATFRYHADASRMAVLGVSLSLPFILGSILQGLVVDRWSPKWLMVIGYAIFLSAIPIAWFGATLGALYASSFLIGGAFATVEPSRSALTALLVSEDHLVQANGTLAVAFQISLAAGPLASGLVLATFGSGTVYAIAAMLALLPPALTLAVPDVRQRGERPGFSFADMRAGASRVIREPELRTLLAVTALGWLLINVFFVLEPLFVKTTLHRGGNSLLYLWGAHGLGALAGSLAVARTRRALGHEGTLVCVGTAAIGAGIFAYAAAGVFGVSLAAAAVSGLGFALLFAPLLALIQRVVPQHQRGRVTSVFVASQEAMGLVSSLAIVVLGALVVVRPTLVVSGIVIAVVGLVGLAALRDTRTAPGDAR